MTGVTQPDPMIGRTMVDRYRIDEPVARGGMARVYRARDVRLERDVAIKILSHPYADDPAFTERFLAEARAAASLSHPSLVHVYDSGSDGEAHFIVMELLDRHRSLRETLDQDGPMPREAVLRIGRELLAGLRVVHDRGLVHCDVKSSNVMLGPGPAKLIDFGIARPPHQELDGDTSIGSLQFMSPEQLRGDALTPASDLFSLGAVLYEALTGRLPYTGRTPEEISAAHAAGPVRPPSAFVAGASGRLDDVILQALRPEAGSRFRSAEAMARALEAAEDDAGLGGATDETRVVAIPKEPAPAALARSGYVPPPAPSPSRPAAPMRTPDRRSPPRRTASRRRIFGMVGPLLILGVVALVVLLLIVPLLDLGSGGDGGSPPASPSTTSGPSAAPGTVLVPQTVGLSTADAIEAASEAGLDWTVRCNQDPQQPEGIVDQEPPADTPVAPGSAFTMYSARISDCR